MSYYDHHCPELSPSSKKPNMLALSCADRVKKKQGKCAKCSSGIGYTAPVNKKPGRKPNPPKPPKKRYCDCGNEIQKNKVKCAECVSKNRAISQAKYNLKTKRKRLQASIAGCEKRLAEYRRRLRESA